ncbi:MAG: response regulator [Candidatus Dormibacteraeota bacterium]|nr:response regulator [Candidatus Dormibacteraeota bacterium]
MAEAGSHETDGLTMLIFENDPRQAIAYRELFEAEGNIVETPAPTSDVQALCERTKPALVLFDMNIWEADTAYVYGVLTAAEGFTRPVIIALCTLPHQVRRAKRFGADGIWIRGVDDAAELPHVAADLLARRKAGTLKPRVPATPL